MFHGKNHSVTADNAKSEKLKTHHCSHMTWQRDSREIQHFPYINENVRNLGGECNFSDIFSSVLKHENFTHT